MSSRDMRILNQAINRLRQVQIHHPDLKLFFKKNSVSSIMLSTNLKAIIN